MLRILHLFTVGLYLILPIAEVARVVLSRRRRANPDVPSDPPPDPTTPRLGSLIVTVISGFTIALVMCFVYGYALKGRVPWRQVAIGTYFATSLILLLRCFDTALLWTLRRIARLHRPGGGDFSRGVRSVLVLSLRAVILAAVGLPFVMAAVTTYRPKIEPRDDPLTKLGFPFQRVEFETADHVKLAGWWIPAIEPPRSRHQPGSGTETVVVCHGLAAGKSNQLILARALASGGFNVLIFDFRAHGESGGQITGYGTLEKEDVLAAVKWVRGAHPQQSEKIFGVGASMGAVALLAAAADDSPEGRAIDAVASYAAYDDFHALVRDVNGFYFRQPLPALIEWIGVPLASLHVGVDMAHFAPQRLVPRLWPRPVLFIHGEQDEIIPIERGQALYEAATQPKYFIWFPKGTHNDILEDEGAAEIVREFFRSATPVPVI